MNGFEIRFWACDTLPYVHHLKEKGHILNNRERCYNSKIGNIGLVVADGTVAAMAFFTFRTVYLLDFLYHLMMVQDFPGANLYVWDRT